MTLEGSIHGLLGQEGAGRALLTLRTVRAQVWRSGGLGVVWGHAGVEGRGALTCGEAQDPGACRGPG